MLEWNVQSKKQTNKQTKQPIRTYLMIKKLKQALHTDKKIYSLNAL